MKQIADGIDEESIDNFISEFTSQIKSANRLSTSDNNEWDMEATYRTNHACIWNNVSSTGEPCKLIGKNDKFAILQFEKEKLNVMDMSIIYRLEDLTNVLITKP